MTALIRLLSLPVQAVVIGHYKYTSSQHGQQSENPWIRKSTEIDGWLFDGEHEYLWELAARPCEGHVLEIGSWMGKSTCILAGACIDTAPETKVFCIDTFDMRGNPEQETIHRWVRGDAPGTFYDFMENAKKFEFYSHIVPITNQSETVLPALTEKFRMVFIDSTHDAQQLRTDVELCAPKITPGGILALHDTVGNAFPDYERYVHTTLAKDRRFRLLGTRNTLTAFEKIEGLPQERRTKK